MMDGSGTAYARVWWASGSAKLPGGGTNYSNKWFRRSISVGSDNGNVAWAMLACCRFDDVSASSRFPRWCGTAWHLGRANGPTRAVLAVSRAYFGPETDARRTDMEIE